MPDYPGFREKKTYYVEEIDNLKRLLREAQSENEALLARVAELTQALTATRDNMIDWSGYVDKYFLDKHDLSGDIALANKALRFNNLMRAPENPFILRKQAEAVEKAYKSTVLATHGDHPHYEKGFDDAMNQYDSQIERCVSDLRQQADEAEKAGGGQ